MNECKVPVTVIVPVRNEESNLSVCLSKLKAFDQLLVVDSCSTDRTPEIVRQYDAEYVNFFWDGKFPKKRNWALNNLIIRNNWVFFVDADEYVTEEFITEVYEKIKDPEINGYWLKYQNFFMGKLLRHGYPFNKLALFRVGKGKYEFIPEDSWSNLDMEVHEHPIIQGKTGQIKAPIVHHDYKGLEHYIARHNAYSSWEARRYLNLQKDKSHNLTVNQKIKYKLLHLGILPIAYFIGAYLLRLGFLDGQPGYYIAKYKAHYFFQIQTKIKEIKQVGQDKM